MTESGTRLRTNTLMMIDDNVIDQMMYKRIVSRCDEVESFVQFTDAREALDYLLDKTNEQPSLILLDINMPGMDGFDFLDQATSKLGTEMCPVIVMLTTSLNPQDEARARSYDVVHDFLNKPLTQEMLRQLTNLARNG